LAQDKIFVLERKLADLTSQNQKSNTMLNLMSEYTNEVVEKIPVATQDRIDITEDKLTIELIQSKQQEAKATPVFKMPDSQV